jgi:hypothetical protein
MRPMARRLAAATIALALAGCGAEERRLPATCLGEPATIVRALQRAPGAVTLADGTRLSTCVRLARREGELQALGVSLTAAADILRTRARSDTAAATGLGYLAAAVRAGAMSNQGLASELARRIDNASALDGRAPQAAHAALARGLRAGAGSG